MATLMQTYEQQYSNLTAEITSKIGQIPNLSGSEKHTSIGHVDRLMEETRELLEQMDLEAREMAPSQRHKYSTRLSSYKTELTKLEKDLRRSRISFGNQVVAREELLGDESAQSEDQRQRLLDNSDTLERSGKRLDHGYKTVLETEELGAAMLADLHGQREQVQKSRERLRETNEMLGKSSRVLSGMMRRIIQNRVLLVSLSIALVIIVGVAIYFATKKSNS